MPVCSGPTLRELALDFYSRDSTVQKESKNALVHCPSVHPPACFPTFSCDWESHDLLEFGPVRISD